MTSSINHPHIPDHTEYRQHLNSEANSSISFANTLATLGTAIVGFLLTQKLEHLDIAIIYPVLLVFCSFFSSIFYANVTGAIRHHGEAEAIKPMILGNAVTEYFGVYLIVLILPIIVSELSKDNITTIAVSSAIYIAFSLYQMTGFDLLSRTFENKYTRCILTIIFIWMSMANVVVAKQHDLVSRFTVIGLTITFLFYLMVSDIFIHWKYKIRG